MNTTTQPAKFYVCIWTRKDNGELTVNRTYEFDSIEQACAAAEKLRNRYDEFYPLINVQYSDGRVYADYEL